MQVQEEQKNSSSGGDFLKKFRTKSGDAHSLYVFREEGFDVLSKESREKEKPMLLYLWEEKNPICDFVDVNVINSDFLNDFLSKYICLGLDCDTEEGQIVKSKLSVDNLPHICILVFPWSLEPECIGSRNGEECSIDGIIDMIAIAESMIPTIPYKKDRKQSY